jgi:hypothetical protein
MNEEKLTKLIETRKKERSPNLGGARPGAGRPRKMDEDKIIEKLRPMAEAAFSMLHKKVEEGDIKALQIYFSYYLGLPTQKIESKIEGQLNQVQIKVVKPANFEEAEVIT